MGCRRLVYVGTAEEPDGELRRAAPRRRTPRRKRPPPYTPECSTAFTTCRRFGAAVFDLRAGQETTKLIPYTILKLLERESPRLTSANRLCDFVHVEDVVRGMLHAAVRAGVEGQTLDLGSGQVASIRAAVELVASTIGVPGLLRFAAAPDSRRTRALIADVESSRRFLVCQVSRWTLRAGLEDTIRWYQKTS